MPDIQTGIRMPRGKFDGINALANERGVIAALAMDQRGSLRNYITKAQGHPASEAQLSEFKVLVSEVLTPYASAILLDPEYGLEAVKRRAHGVGVLLAYEETGYDPNIRGRLPALLPLWSVRRLLAAWANVGIGEGRPPGYAPTIKVLLYYDPDDDEQINSIKQALIERVGAECSAYEAPFFLEILAYSDKIGDEKSLEFARVKPSKVIKYMQEFSKPQYGIDVLKVEVPVNMRYVEGSRANTGGQVAYSREEAKQYFQQAAAASRLPFIYLSAGVSNEVFLETLELAAEANTPYSGVLCGRATWLDGVEIYAKQGPDALRKWLQSQGVHNI